MARGRQHIDRNKYNLNSSYVSKSGLRVNTYTPKLNKQQTMERNERITQECVRFLKSRNKL